jgi:hypothetical protein
MEKADSPCLIRALLEGFEAGAADRAWAQGFFSGKLTSPTLIFLISNYRTASSRPPDPSTSPTSAGSVGIVGNPGIVFPCAGWLRPGDHQAIWMGPERLLAIIRSAGDCWGTTGLAGGPRLSAACSSGGHAGMRHDDRCFCTKRRPAAPFHAATPRYFRYFAPTMTVQAPPPDPQEPVSPSRPAASRTRR